MAPTTTGGPAADDEGTVLTDRAGHAFSMRPVVCPICRRSDERELGMRGGRYHRYGQGVPTRVVQCRGCSLIYPNPFPFPVESAKLYGDPDKYFEGHDEEGKVEGSRALVREAARRLGRARFSLLDVGCGRAELLRAARLEGLDDVLGLDFSPAMVERAARKFGLEVVPQGIAEYAASAGRTFDAISLGAVIEHVYDPDAMIAAAAALTRPGAVLYLDTPNEPNFVTAVGNAAHRVVGNPSVYNLSPTWSPFHVFGFNERSLRLLLGKHGFRIESIVAFGNPHIPARGGPADRAKAFVATQINRVANRLGKGHNLTLWAVRA
jgi:2-polyprenyl-3-methyl-5-hydroxy-6-metoxy-1,4-benzoquinol methylase